MSLRFDYYFFQSEKKVRSILLAPTRPQNLRKRVEVTRVCRENKDIEVVDEEEILVVEERQSVAVVVVVVVEVSEEKDLEMKILQLDVVVSLLLCW